MKKWYSVQNLYKFGFFQFLVKLQGIENKVWHNFLLKKQCENNFFIKKMVVNEKQIIQCDLCSLSLTCVWCLHAMFLYARIHILYIYLCIYVCTHIPTYTHIFFIYSFTVLFDTYQFFKMGGAVFYIKHPLIPEIYC